MYRGAKIRAVTMLILSSLVFAAGLAYLAFSNALGIYRWQLGLASVAALFIAISVFSIYYKEYHALFIAARCPRCDGILQVTELEVSGAKVLDNETLPPIMDIITSCTNCKRQHHRVFAKWADVGPVSRQSWGDAVKGGIQHLSSIILLQRPGLNDQELATLFNNWESYPRKPQTTRAEWEATLERLQREAWAKNSAAGMIFPDDKI